VGGMKKKDRGLKTETKTKKQTDDGGNEKRQKQRKKREEKKKPDVAITLNFQT
jgi:hypothetical protein